MELVGFLLKRLWQSGERRMVRLESAPQDGNIGEVKVGVRIVWNPDAIWPRSEKPGKERSTDEGIRPRLRQPANKFKEEATGAT